MQIYRSFSRPGLGLWVWRTGLGWLLGLSGLILTPVSAVTGCICLPCLHAHAEGVQLAVEVLGGLGQNQARVPAGVPGAAQAQRDLLDQVVERVALHADRLVRVKVDALLRHGQDAQAGASQPGDGHQVVGPDDVTYRQRCV